MQISILDFNTQGTPLHSPHIKERYQKTAQLINQEKADIVCLQEISTYYNFLIMKKSLNYPHFVYKPFIHAPYGGVIIASKIPLQNVHFVEYKTRGSWRDLSRITHLVRNGMLFATIAGTNTTIINTHTFSDFEFEWSPTNQFYRIVKAQIEQLTSEVEKLLNSGRNIILTGDFNSKKNSTLYKYIRERTKLIDIFGDESSPTYFPERLDYTFKGKSAERIDFMLYKAGREAIKVISKSHFATEKVTIMKNKKDFLSDHIGLQATFELL